MQYYIYEMDGCWVTGAITERRRQDTHELSVPIPAGELLGDFIVTHPESLIHDLPCFGHRAHHSVFDAVVDHLDVVTGTSCASIAHTWTASTVFGGDLSQKGHECVQCFLFTARAH